MAENRLNSVQLVFHQRAVEAAREAFDNLKKNYQEFTLDAKYGNHSIWLKKGEQLERFCLDLKELIKQIEMGWEKKQIQVEA